MNYAAGLVALGIIVVLYILYRVTQKAFNVVFGVMCVHAYLLLVDRVYPEASLLRVVYSPASCSCSNQTSSPLLPPITLEPPITLTELGEKIHEQVPSEWKSWIPSFLSSPAMVSETQMSAPREEPTPKPKPVENAKAKVNDKYKEDFEAFQRWRASQKDL